ncbi:nicotinate mononucleotide-dependent phosphoribosyltransferase CobT [Leptothoe sp. PORK10 BA2]|uniref:nicotinate mononucleotide-dependent phosphoribosyltransferase CobT n=1 Tax=Leptothoe sp. PORK10 BA2 TaxID=3110254 RepID=UPI002B206237|nr:TIGR00303 family protein [Leptothoe sp. PORK10 BA2]MEA5463050.1 TIGR00303 family protein [Leptothoe sp. PORK10 BA2]
MSPESPRPHGLIAHHTNRAISQKWQHQYQGQRPCYVCVLGFTETALIPGISAAGNTPEARLKTAVADAEFIYDGPTAAPQYPLPPLRAGVSPALLTRAMVTGLNLPIYLFNAGLPLPPSVPHVDLHGAMARCVSSGQALDPKTVEQLFKAGLQWGETLGRRFAGSYLIVGECVVAGTTTAQAVLTALGFDVAGLMGSSHPTCNHKQKAALIKTGLMSGSEVRHGMDVWAAIAAVGDPMQPFVIGMTLAASHHSGVLLAGGSQMLAIYTMLQQLGTQYPWHSNNVVIGTTQWIVQDETSQFLKLAHTIPTPPIMSSRFSFKASHYPQFTIFEQGYVKEGVGAGGCLIAGHLYQNWQQEKTLQAMEAILESCPNSPEPSEKS